MSGSPKKFNGRAPAYKVSRTQGDSVVESGVEAAKCDHRGPTPGNPGSQAHRINQSNTCCRNPERNNVNFTDFFIRRAVTTTLLMAAILIFGIFSYSTFR